jgi:ribosomal protein S18 acetylase RimI-like enzyme
MAVALPADSFVKNKPSGRRSRRFAVWSLLAGKEPEVEYRLLQEKDIAAMRLFVDDQNTSYDAASLKNFIREKDSYGFVAVQGARIIGFAYGYLLPKPDGNRTFYLHAVDVMAEAQGNGYGTELVKYIIGFARELGCAKMFLIVEGDNSAAIHCYEKAGGVRVENAHYVYHFR